jgi:hypothetical protein
MGGSRATGGGAEPGGNVVGVDPHKRTLSAAGLDERDRVLGTRHFRVSGHRELQGWVLSFGAVTRWGVEGPATPELRRSTPMPDPRAHQRRCEC